METGIPDKLYMKIGEVSAITGLPASVLRFWETEFDSLKPKKSKSGQRLYTKKDIEQIAEIKQLLYAEKLTIEGARKRMESRKRNQKSELVDDTLTSLLQDIREELRILRDQMS